MSAELRTHLGMQAMKNAIISAVFAETPARFALRSPRRFPMLQHHSSARPSLRIFEKCLTGPQLRRSEQKAPGMSSKRTPAAPTALQAPSGRVCQSKSKSVYLSTLCNTECQPEKHAQRRRERDELPSPPLRCGLADAAQAKIDEDAEAREHAPRGRVPRRAGRVEDAVQHGEQRDKIERERGGDGGADESEANRGRAPHCGA